MKKTLSVLLCILLPLPLLFGCAEDREIPDNRINDSISETAVASRLRTVNVSKPENNPIDKSEFMQEYYLDTPLALEYPIYATYYANSSTVSTEFTEFWAGNYDVMYYPVYGTFLEFTRLFVISFYNDDAVANSFTLVVETDEEEYSVTEFTHESYTRESYSNGELTATGPFHRNCITSDLQQATEYGGNAAVQGFVFDTQSYAMPYMIATELNQTHLKYWDNENLEWTDFRLVDEFETIEDGQQAFENYFEKKAELYNSIPIYEWTESVEDTVYFNRFVNSHRDGVLGEYETYVTIPLLDEELEENGCVLFLLYYHNDLIGEIVIRGNDAEGEEVWRREASKDPESGQYIPLGSSYLSAIEKATANGKLDVRGVSFKDGQLSPVGFNTEGSVMIYDSQTSDVQSVSDYLN